MKFAVVVGIALLVVAGGAPRSVSAGAATQRFTIVPAESQAIYRVDRMRQVLLNLLDNAVRFTPDGGTVGVTVRVVGDGKDRVAELSVEDEGPGIPRDDFARIFEPFYRSDPSRSRASGGSGLGLAVVKHLVAVHGGEVRAENRVTGGARIAIRLPAPV